MVGGKPTFGAAVAIAGDPRGQPRDGVGGVGDAECTVGQGAITDGGVTPIAATGFAEGDESGDGDFFFEERERATAGDGGAFGMAGQKNLCRAKFAKSEK